EPRGHRGHRATAVRLQGAHGNEGVRALIEGVGHEEFELAYLVAGLEHAGEVVTLEVELDAEAAGDALELHDGRGRHGKLDAPRRLRHIIILAPSPLRLIMLSAGCRHACCFLRSAAMGAKS